MRSNDRTDLADNGILDLKALSCGLGDLKTFLLGIGGKDTEIFDAPLFANICFSDIKNAFDGF